eukprot:scaffold151125_cov15-Tisochrysis_lutea.AAC.1
MHLSVPLQMLAGCCAAGPRGNEQQSFCLRVSSCRAATHADVCGAASISLQVIQGPFLGSPAPKKQESMFQASLETSRNH